MMKTNLLLLCVALIIISFFVVLNIFFENNYQAEMAEQFSRQQGLLARMLGDNIGSTINHLIDETESLAVVIQDAPFTKSIIAEFIRSSFEELGEKIDIDIKFLDAEGKLLYSTRLSPPVESDVVLFNMVRGLKKGEVFGQMSNDRTFLRFATPIYSGKNIFRGAIFTDVYMDSFNRRFLKTARLGENGYTWMMDSDGTLIYHPTQPEMIGKNIFYADQTCFRCHRSFEIEKKIINESQQIGHSSYVAPSGEDKLIAFSKIRFLDKSWIVCVSIPYSEVMASMRKSMKLHSVLVISIFLTMFFGAAVVVVINKKRIKAEERSRYLEEQKRLVDTIYETKLYLENIIESTQSGIVVIDENYYITLANTAYSRLIGLSIEEIKGKRFFDVCPKTSNEEKEKIHNLIQQALKGIAGSLREFSLRRGKDVRYVYVVASPLIFHERVSGVIISCDDITDEIELRNKLREYALTLEEMVEERTGELKLEKEKLNLIVRTVDAGICVVDEKGNITWFNRKMEDWFGKIDENIRIYNLLPVSIDEMVLNENPRRVFDVDINGRRRIFQISITPFREPSDKKNYIALIQDITEAKRLEERMMQSEKLAALARVSAGLAHEIGNPLTSISSYIQILKEMDLGEFANESVNTISNHIQRIAMIVRDISRFSKPVAVSEGPVDVKEAVDSTVSLVRYDKRMKDINLEIDIPKDFPPVYGDINQLIQVFTNLIFNAADAMPDGGSLVIRAQREGEKAVIEFRDTGTGISLQDINRIFDPFFTTKEKGTGLGLAVSYSIIKSFGGDILVESELGKGSTFRIVLRFYERMKG